ncbi:hypothetical protein [Ralstonia insidiosa]|uniref:hypothetical protein n=1 Tax=Ralstonia insidiosa TaxID=190721 RepID=UPI000CEE34AF|nr:hypothetical protein [Ralstonia insidiosa]
MSTEETTQPGIVGEIVSEFHKLEEKVEHLIHPDAAVQSPPVDNAHVEAGAEQFTSAPVVNEGNATEALATSSNSSTESLSGSAPAGDVVEDPNAGLTPGPTAHQWTPEQIAQIQALGQAPIPIAAASNAGDLSASDTPSSVAAASPNGGTPGISVSVSLAGEALKSIQKIRDHLWTFEYGAVAHLHVELDKLEAFFR